jgi:diadenosine tetraphosphate (Ap4A) HIT family hydrolase
MSAECTFCRKMATLEQMPEDEVVWQFEHSVAFLGPWQFYHGYCVLASRLHASELSQLNDEVRLYFLDEMCTLAKAIEECFQPRKLNYEMLGNQTPHLHWHVIPRYAHDTDPTHPIWSAIERARDNRPERHRLRTGPLTRSETAAALRERLAAMPQ